MNSDTAKAVPSHPSSFTRSVHPSEQRWERARLALEDGTVYEGRAFGARGTREGEVVFNTSLTGYQEIITDPSYAGQIVVMTAPQIGNTGVTAEDNEAVSAFLSGFVVRDLSPTVSNWRAEESLDEWLTVQGVVGITDVDTRAITRKVRDEGAQRGVISTDDTLSDDELVERARAWPGLIGVDLVKEVTCEEPYHWHEPSDREWLAAPEGLEEQPFHVVAYDFGLKRNILRRLASHGCRVTVVPADTPAEEVLALDPDGVFLSNGPGDPTALPYAVEATRAILERGRPLFGICLGHQILGRAIGAETYKLPFGHHGGNQPVSYVDEARVEISAHNHNFAVDLDTLPDNVQVTHINLNDGCCEGLRLVDRPAFSVQYHPEAAPGPHDADYLFRQFVSLMEASSPRGGKRETEDEEDGE
ncbi:MAG: glutamine-hydrolyzing carbamoyl-phosphate synthase small subunit [Chloroflexota bacterium]|nr:glutamine-hydrolyzing carbamoyl-phosphate synthase small subunit [Chloroflexota bacterium]